MNNTAALSKDDLRFKSPNLALPNLPLLKLPCTNCNMTIIHMCLTMSRLLFSIELKFPLLSHMIDIRLFIVLYVALVGWFCKMQQLLHLPGGSLALCFSAKLVSQQPVVLFRTQRKSMYMVWKKKGMYCSMVGKVRHKGQGIADGWWEMDHSEWED